LYNIISRIRFFRFPLSLSVIFPKECLLINRKEALVLVLLINSIILSF